MPTSANELYGEVALRWRSRTRAGERAGPGVPPSHGINDSYLNVSRRSAPACSEMSVEEEDAALGHLRTFAASGGSLDLERRCGLGMGSEQFGAVAPRASTRTRKAPESLQMPPTMRGGDRAWQERMPAEVEIDHECSVRMTRGSTGRRGLAKRGAKKELQSGDDTEAPSSAQGERPGVVAQSKAKGVREVDDSLRDPKARSSRVRAADPKDGDAGAVAERKTRQPRRGSDEAKSGSTRETTKVLDQCDRQLRSRSARRVLRLLRWKGAICFATVIGRRSSVLRR